MIQRVGFGYKKSVVYDTPQTALKPFQIGKEQKDNTLR